MSRQTLKRVREEIKTALDTAQSADRAVNDPLDSSIDADAFRQIARPLRRALRLVEGEPTTPRGVLQLEDVETSEATRDEIEEWKLDGAIYAEMLSTNKCPKSFRDAFTAIFEQRLLEPCHASHPLFISTFFPLVVLSFQGFEPAEALEVVEVLRLLRETLAPELTRKIKDEMGMD
jgi:hypothetical protein